MGTRKAKTRQTPKGIGRRARRLYHLTPRFVHGMVIGAFVGIVTIMTFGPIFPAYALSINSPRDCDTNAVITCGALTTKELQKGYTKPGVKNIYSHFGISATDIKNIDKSVKAGRVYKNGEVRVGDKVVATNALTAGREFISGSKKVTIGGTIFYTRAPSVSFRVKSIAAFVVMKDGKFDFAVLAACGNPVQATAKSAPKPAPPPEEDEPEELPNTVALKTSTQTPESTPTPQIIPAEVEAATTLPVTGPGEVGLVVCLAVIGGYLYHVTHRRIRRKRHSS